MTAAVVLGMTVAGFLLVVVGSLVRDRRPLRFLGDGASSEAARDLADLLRLTPDGPTFSGRVGDFDVRGEVGDLGTGTRVSVATGLDWTFRASSDHAGERQYSGDARFDAAVAFLPARRALSSETRALLVEAVRDGIEHLGGELELCRVPASEVPAAVHRLVALGEALRRDHTTPREAAEGDPEPEVRLTALRWALADDGFDDAWLRSRQDDPHPAVGAEAAALRGDTDWLLDAADTGGAARSAALAQLARIGIGADPRLDRALIAAFAQRRTPPEEWLELAGRSATVAVVPALRALALPLPRLLPVIRRIQARSAGERGAISVSLDLGAGTLTEAAPPSGGLSEPGEG